MTVGDDAISAAAEVGFKFYLAGASGSAIALFGMALVVGLAGGTSFAALAAAAKTPALGLGVLLTLAGMGYKLGVAPFHMWMPDTYEGATTPFVAFLAVAPKIAGLTAAMNLFFTGFAQEQAVWLPVLPVLAGVSLVVGGLMYFVGLRGVRLLLFAFLVSGAIAMVVLKGRRQGAAYGITHAVKKVNDRIDASSRAEDEDDLDDDLADLDKSDDDAEHPGDARP